MNRLGQKLIILGWSLYLFSLVLPVSYTHTGQAELGWQYALVSLVWFADPLNRSFWYFAPSSIGNILMMVSPIITMLGSARVHFVTGLMLLGFSFFAVNYFFDLMENFTGLGYFVWVLAVLVSCAGFFAKSRSYA